VIDTINAELWVLGLYIRKTRRRGDLWSLVRARWLKRKGVVRVHAPAIGTLAVRGGTSDMSVVGEVLAGAYDVALDTLPDRAVVVDLGAHIGVVTRAVLERHAAAQVIAVEANPANVSLLERNVPDAKVIGQPVAATHRHVGLTDERLDGCRIVDGGAMKTITLDDIPGPIDLLKVDVEGVEEELFADCKGWIDRVTVIVCECHYPYTAAQMLEAIGDARVLDLQELPQYGYDLVTVRVTR